MDPLETLKLALASLAEGDKHAASEALEHYWTWIRNGGFEPQMRGNDVANSIQQIIDVAIICT